MSQTIREIMSSNVATITPQDSVIKAAQIMSHYNIGSVPVVENGNVVGILTDRDIVLRSVALGGDLSQIQAQQVMTSNVVTATPDMGIENAAQMMASNQIRRLPVVENQQLVGMVALGDLAIESEHIDEAGDALNSISRP